MCIVAVNMFPLKLTLRRRWYLLWLRDVVSAVDVVAVVSVAALVREVVVVGVRALSHGGDVSVATGVRPRRCLVGCYNKMYGTACLCSNGLTLFYPRRAVLEKMRKLVSVLPSLARVICMYLEPFANQTGTSRRIRVAVVATKGEGVRG